MLTCQRCGCRAMGHLPKLYSLDVLDTPCPMFEPNNMMSQFRCVWLGRLSKCILLGGLQDRVWGEGQHAAVLHYATRGRWNIHKTQTRAFCSMQFQCSTCSVCIYRNVFWEVYFTVVKLYLLLLALVVVIVAVVVAIKAVVEAVVVKIVVVVVIMIVKYLFLLFMSLKLFRFLAGHRHLWMKWAMLQMIRFCLSTLKRV